MLLRWCALWACILPAGATGGTAHERYDGIVSYDINGNDVSDNLAYRPFSDPTLFYSPIELNDPSQLVNNAIAWGYPGVALHINDVTTTRTGARVAMEIFNTSEYRFANNDANGFLGRMLQFNIAPLFDTTGATQPFQYLTSIPGMTPAFSDMSFDAAHVNMVGLFYRFVDETTGADIELEEFSIAVFDFDQDWADGNKAYVRESMIFADWHTCLVTNTSAVDVVFGQVPVPAVTSTNTAAPRLPNGFSTVLKPGVTVRS